MFPPRWHGLLFLFRIVCSVRVDGESTAIQLTQPKTQGVQGDVQGAAVKQKGDVPLTYGDVPLTYGTQGVQGAAVKEKGDVALTYRGDVPLTYGDVPLTYGTGVLPKGKHKVRHIFFEWNHVFSLDTHTSDLGNNNRVSAVRTFLQNLKNLGVKVDIVTYGKMDNVLGTIKENNLAPFFNQVVAYEHGPDNGAVFRAVPTNNGDFSVDTLFGSDLKHHDLGEHSLYKKSSVIADLRPGAGAGEDLSDILFVDSVNWVVQEVHDAAKTVRTLLIKSPEGAKQYGLSVDAMKSILAACEGA